MLELVFGEKGPDKFFFTTRKIAIEDGEMCKDFVKNYLDDQNYKVSSIFSYLKDPYWKNYSDEVKKLKMSEDLIFRGKVANFENNCVEVINIWSSKKV
jgi:hypothetical protein